MRTPSCSKVGYASKHEAKAAKRSCQQAAASGASKRRESRIYRCGDCGAWHLTSVPHRNYDSAEA